jgi:hypothetical protein
MLRFHDQRQRRGSVSGAVAARALRQLSGAPLSPRALITAVASRHQRMRHIACAAASWQNNGGERRQRNRRRRGHGRNGININNQRYREAA